jgi:hypothetical protein
MFRSNRSTLESLHPGVRMVGKHEVIRLLPDRLSLDQNEDQPNLGHDGNRPTSTLAIASRV